MARVLTDEQNYYDIADAIREKLGVETTYLPSEMADAIESIETGTDLTSEDEGKVVVEDAGIYVLAAQTSLSVTQNGTYDTTENNEVVVSVSGGGGMPTGYTYYNGVLLPTIPTVSGYDYVWIRRNDLTSKYDAIYGTGVWYTDTPANPTLENFHIIYDGASTNKPKMCSIPFASASSGNWGEMTESYGGFFGTDNREVLWSSHDMKVGGSSGEILLAGGYAVNEIVKVVSSQVEPEYQGYSYGFISGTNFSSCPSMSCYVNFYKVDSGREYFIAAKQSGMNRQRLSFFLGKEYSDFTDLVQNGYENGSKTVSDGVSVISTDNNASNNTPIDFTAPSDGIIVYQTNNASAEFPTYCFDVTP